VDKYNKQQPAINNLSLECVLPGLNWNAHPIKTGNLLSTGLNIESSLLLKKNNAKNAMFHLGNNRLGICGSMPSGSSCIDVVDTMEGKVIWHKDNYDTFNIPAPVFDNTAVYISQNIQGNRFISSHNPETGFKHWQCNVGKNKYILPKSFCQSEKYLFNINVFTRKLCTIQKRNGELVSSVKLVKSVDKNKLIHIHTWYDQVILITTDPNSNHFVVDLYNPIAGIYFTLTDLGNKCRPIASFVYNNYIYILNHSGQIFKINLENGIIVKNTECKAGNIIGFNMASDKKLHYFLVQNGNTKSIHYIYDIVSDNFYEFETNSVNESVIYTNSKILAEVSDTNNQTIGIYNLYNNKKITSVSLPDYGGKNYIKHFLRIDDSIYVAQKAGITYGEDNTILHCLR